MTATTVRDIFIGGAISAAVTVLGHAFNFINTSRELDIRMVDVALTILSAKDEGTKSVYARRYALDLLEKYSGTKIRDKDAWSTEGSVPVGAWPSTSAGSCFWDVEKCDDIRKLIIPENPGPKREQ